LEVNAAESTVLKTNAVLTGLPDFANTFLFVDIKKLSTNLKDIESIKDSETGKSLVDVPNNLYSLNTISYSGNFTGFISDFVAYGTLKSAIGNLSIDLSFKPDENLFTNFSGQVSTRELNLGHLLGNELLGKTSLKATVQGTTKTLLVLFFSMTQMLRLTLWVRLISQTQSRFSTSLPLCQNST
jgi:hypothetical protein